MRPVDALGLAMQNVRRTRLRTALSAVGVAIGTAAVVALIAGGNGFEQIAVARAARFGSLTEIIVSPEQDGGQPHAITPATVSAWKAARHVAAVDTSLQLPPLRIQVDGMAADLPAQSSSPLTDRGGLLTAINPAPANGVLLPSSLVKKTGQMPQAVLGRSVTLTAGSSVCCATDRNTLTVLGPDHTFLAEVAGVYDDSQAASASNDRGGDSITPLVVTTELAATVDGAFAGMSGAQYIDRQGYAETLVTVDDARQTAAVAAQIRGQGYRVTDRADLLAQVHLVFNIITAGLAAIGSIALLVAAIGIANTMIMTVLERTREIGIMKALGAEPASIRTLFLVESGLTGIMGGVAGILLALGVVFVGNMAFGRYIANQNLGATVGDLFVVTPPLIVAGLAVATGVSLLGGALPSRRAVALQPLDALRYE